MISIYWIAQENEMEIKEDFEDSLEEIIYSRMHNMKFLNCMRNIKTELKIYTFQDCQTILHYCFSKSRA